MKRNLVMLAVAAVVAIAAAIGGYAVGRHSHTDDSERQTAQAPEQ